MTEPRRCPECHAILAPDLATAGLCSRCLLMLGLGFDRAPDATTALPAPPRTTAARRILTLLGMGPHGRLYLAEQERPRRLLAVKVFDRVVEMRGEADRVRALVEQLIALEHPAIVPVVDGGLTEDAHPYLVSEFLRGVTFDQYCRRLRPSRRDLLSGLARVADAVQHAHDAGLAHGHLVGGNILAGAGHSSSLGVCDFGCVALAGGRPTPAADVAALVSLATQAAGPDCGDIRAVAGGRKAPTAAVLAVALRRLAASGQFPA
jgi:serine/threonine protein kinase